MLAMSRVAKKSVGICGEGEHLEGLVVGGLVPTFYTEYVPDPPVRSLTVAALIVNAACDLSTDHRNHFSRNICSPTRAANTLDHTRTAHKRRCGHNNWYHKLP